MSALPPRYGRGLDEEQLRALYAEHGRALYAFALKGCGDRSLAEDVVQETLLRAWKRAPALDEHHVSLRGWLFVVARHVLIDFARARASRAEFSREPLPEQAGQVDDFDRAVESWQMLSALELLSAAHRDVLVQLYYLDRTMQQAAQALGVPVGTVKSRAYYALRAQRVALQDLGVSP